MPPRCLPTGCRPSSTPSSRSRERTPGGCSDSRTARASTSSTSVARAGWPSTSTSAGCAPTSASTSTCPGRGSSCCTPSCTRRTPVTTPRAASRRWPWCADAGCWSRPSWSCRRRSRWSRRAWPSWARPCSSTASTGPTYEAVVRDAGVDIDLAHDRTVAAAVEPVLRIQADAGQLLHADGWSEDAVLDYLRQWALVDDTLLEHVGPLRRRSREPGVRRVLPGGPRALPGVRAR